MAICDRVGNFLKGMGTIFQIMPPKRTLGDFFEYYRKATPEEMDAAALQQDWETVSADFGYALGNSKKLYKNQ